LQNRVDIRPEPTDAEREAIEALVVDRDDEPPDRARSGWRRAALEEAVGGDEAYGFAPGL
jgi:hypothetical protein